MTKSRTMTKDQFVADRHGRLMTATGIAGKVNDKTFLGDDWRHVDFRGSNLHQCDWEAGVDVSDAVFPGASFTRCSMRYGRFHDANIKHAEFQDCDLSGATFDNADIRGAHFDWCGLQGSSFSSGTKISDVSFRGADLRDASLTGAVMKRCDLRGADLRGATGIPDAAELVENGCTLAGAVGVVRADRDLAKYTVLRPDAHKDPAHYETATPMAAIATHLRDFPRDRRGRGKIELETAVVNNEPVKFVVLDNKPHLVVDHGDPTNQIVRLLGIDDAIPMEDAVIYEGDKASRVLRAIDADNHMESRGRSTHDIPLEWRLWNANPLIPGDRNRASWRTSRSRSRPATRFPRAGDRERRSRPYRGSRDGRSVKAISSPIRAVPSTPICVTSSVESPCTCASWAASSKSSPSGNPFDISSTTSGVGFFCNV